MKHRKGLFWFYSLWILPLAAATSVLAYIVCLKYSKPPAIHILTINLLAIIYMYYLATRHQYEHRVYYRDDFSPRANHDWLALGLSKEKLRALYSAPRRENRFKQPQGVVLGRTNSQYVCIPLDKHNLVSGCIIGAPGSGKSSGPYICTLANLFATNQHATCFVVDIKGELSQYSVDRSSRQVKIVDPEDLSSYGWDPYYNLTQSSSDDDVIEALDKIARAIIVDNNPKNAFFVNQARKIMIALCLFFFRKQVWSDEDGNVKSGFADSICEIKSSDVTALIKRVLENQAICSKHKQIQSMLSEFADTDESEAMQGIKLQLGEHLDVFTRKNVMHMLSPDNEKLATPLDLNNGISIFLSIPETKLESMSALFRLIVCQTLSEMENRPPESDVCLILLDELPRIGKLERLMTSLATLRSRQVSIFMAIQDVSQLQYIYGHDAARIILNLCVVICTLSCSDIETGKMLSEWSGYYEEKRKSRTRKSSSSDRSGSVSTSFERRPVVEISDVMRLRTEGGVMLWIEGRYCRVRRIRYFEDKRLNKIAKRNSEKNRQYESIHRQDSAEPEFLFFDDGTITSDELSISETAKEYQLALNQRSIKEVKNNE